jgi:two-component system sensor histidine kinase AtoS
MRRVFINLIINAGQAVSTKRENNFDDNSAYQPRICVGTHLADDHVVIQVEDNGSGMDQDTQKRAFEALFTTKSTGTGLGLAIVQKIIAEHGGRTSLESTQKIGTTIKIELPINENSSA